LSHPGAFSWFRIGGIAGGIDLVPRPGKLPNSAISQSDPGGGYIRRDTSNEFQLSHLILPSSVKIAIDAIYQMR
jgi:hypothetical protein